MKKLAIFFPGIGYHCDKPLLYYARKLTQECGYEESILLSYSYDGRNIRGDEQKMQQAFEALYAQAEQQLSKVDFGKYSEILFVSKSVGTIIRPLCMEIQNSVPAGSVHSAETDLCIPT